MLRWERYLSPCRCICRGTPDVVVEHGIRNTAATFPAHVAVACCRKFAQCTVQHHQTNMLETTSTNFMLTLRSDMQPVQLQQTTDVALRSIPQPQPTKSDLNPTSPRASQADKLRQSDSVQSWHLSRRWALSLDLMFAVYMSRETLASWERGFQPGGTADAARQ